MHIKQARKILPGGRSRNAALVALLGSNLVPLLGVLVLGWPIQALLVVYWLESGIIGAINIPKILCAHGEETASTRSDVARIRSDGETVTLPDAPECVPETPTWRQENMGVAWFFIGNYGMFWAVHGLFIGSFPLMGLGQRFITIAELPAIALGAGVAAVSHYISYRQNYLADGEWRTVSPGGRMNAPYGRVTVMQLTIVLGAFAVAYIGAPVAALVVMVVVKTALDVHGHLQEHDRDKPATVDTL